MPLNNIEERRFQGRLTKELGIEGNEPSPVLAPEIQPVLILENERPELLHLQREHRFMCQIGVAAVAGEYFYFHLWNPAGSRTLIVVEEFGICDQTATSNIDQGVANATFIASLAGLAAYCMDRRIPQNPLGRPCIGQPYAGTDVNTGGIASHGRLRTATNNSYRFNGLNYVLVPGTGWGLFDTTVNSTLSGWCIWRERAARDGELT